MAGLKPMFTMKDVKTYAKSRIEHIEVKTLEALQYAGEEFVNKARTTQTYVDQTGNLRSSIGYVILKDGKVVTENFQGNGEGVNASRSTVDEVASEHPRGYVLIGVAGMNYAAAVESKGYDVITGSAPEDRDVKDLLGAIKL